MDEARKMGANSLNVEPLARNAQAIDFYYEMEFTNLGQIQLFVDFSGKRWERRLKLFKHEFHY